VDTAHGRAVRSVPRTPQNTAYHDQFTRLADLAGKVTLSYRTFSRKVEHCFLETGLIIAQNQQRTKRRAELNIELDKVYSQRCGDLAQESACAFLSLCGGGLFAHPPRVVNKTQGTWLLPFVRGCVVHRPLKPRRANSRSFPTDWQIHHAPEHACGRKKFTYQPLIMAYTGRNAGLSSSNLPCRECFPDWTNLLAFPGLGQTRSQQRGWDLEFARYTA